MTITSEILKKLKEPFAPSQHEFHRGFTYIKEYAICERLDSIDPNWSFTLTENKDRHPQVSVVGTLEILGSRRGNMGMEKVEWTKASKKARKEDPTAPLVPANEPEKSAATDALKRAARLFGIGRYLLQCPKDLTERSLELWLRSRQSLEPTPALVWPEPAAVESLWQYVSSNFPGIDYATVCEIAGAWEQYKSGKDAYIAISAKLNARTEVKRRDLLEPNYGEPDPFDLDEHGVLGTPHGWKGSDEAKMIERFSKTFVGLHHMALLQPMGHTHLTDLGSPEEAWEALEEYAYQESASVICTNARYIKPKTGSPYLEFEAPRPILCYGRSSRFKGMVDLQYYTENKFDTIDNRAGKWQEIDQINLEYERKERDEKNGGGHYYLLTGISYDVPF